MEEMPRRTSPPAALGRREFVDRRQSRAVRGDVQVKAKYHLERNEKIITVYAARYFDEGMTPPGMSEDDNVRWPLCRPAHGEELKDGDERRSFHARVTTDTILRTRRRIRPLVVRRETRADGGRRFGCLLHLVSRHAGVDQSQRLIFAS